MKGVCKNLLLKINNIGKEYKKGFWALHDVSLEITNGVLGILGPNGAGKSTLMKVITTLTKPTTGQVFFNEVNVTKCNHELISHLGYLPQDFGVYENLNAVDFLRYMAAVKGLDMNIAMKRIEELVNLLNLNNAAKKAIGSYSGGMKQRVGIAQALLNDPDILIVDEPTVGLDPEERIRFRNIMTDLAKNKIILLSTHIVSDVEAIASKIAIISKGKLISYSGTDDLLRRVQKVVWECSVSEKQLLDIRDKYVISNAVRYGNDIHVRIVSESKPLIQAYNVMPNLEDAYLYQMNL